MEPHRHRRRRRRRRRRQCLLHLSRVVTRSTASWKLSTKRQEAFVDFERSGEEEEEDADDVPLRAS